MGLVYILVGGHHDGILCLSFLPLLAVVENGVVLVTADEPHIKVVDFHGGTIQATDDLECEPAIGFIDLSRILIATISLTASINPTFFLFFVITNISQISFSQNSRDIQFTLVAIKSIAYFSDWFNSLRGKYQRSNRSTREIFHQTF